MSSESDCGEISDKPKKRKGVTNEETYKRNVIKKARVKGESYTSYKGKNVHAKIQDTFNCKCAERCYSNLSEESKSDLWEYFYSLCSKNEPVSYTHLKYTSYLQILYKTKLISSKIIC